MKNYENKYGLLSFTIDGKDYILNKGDKVDLQSDNEYIKRLVSVGYLEASDKPLKTPKQ